VFSDATPDILDTLGAEVERMSRRIETLIRNRDAVAEYLAEVRTHQDRGSGPDQAHRP
jgi:hypothetical protein